MALPNPDMDFTALEILPASKLDDIVENIQALAAGSAFDAESVPGSVLAPSSVTADKMSDMISATTDGASPYVVPANTSMVALTMNGDTTITSPAGTPKDGQGLMFRIKDNGTARVITWGTIWRAIGVTVPTTTTVSKLIYVTARYNAPDAKWDILSVGKQT